VLGKADQPAGLAPRIPSPGIAELLEAEVLLLCGPKNKVDPIVKTIFRLQ
jgi:hypothetical protein